MANNHNPIGVFDSGVGGLTVYGALRTALPQENFIYLGDTARLPYGTKSAETVTQYAMQIAQVLMKDNIKLLVVACNTASALALPALRKLLPDLPCLGVIEPAAEQAAALSRSGNIAVLATEGTVRSGVYAAFIKHHRTDAHVTMLACNLLVGLAEEGWCEGKEAETVIGRYLDALGGGFDTLVLGCTHFPLLAPTIRKLVGPNIFIIDSASMTASSVKHYLQTQSLFNPQSHAGHSHFQVTDSPQRFGIMARRFLNTDIMPHITLANLSQTSQNDATLQPQKADIA